MSKLPGCRVAVFCVESAASLGGLAWGASPGRADSAPGVTETEIKIGQTMPYSGPSSAYGVIGKTDAARSGRDFLDKLHLAIDAQNLRHLLLELLCGFIS
jgi:hypothetical protein